jgi:Protein of unknown function (DUF1698)
MKKERTLDHYVTGTPSRQAVLDLFQGEWSSAMPPSSGLSVSPATAGLFEDPRVQWFGDVIGGFNGRRVLELGPLESGHTYMLSLMGAREIVAVEANTRAFLKCLCIKELFQLDRARYLLGDCVSYLESSEDQFDVVLASGILYHMTDPVNLLALAAQKAPILMGWTHYYDEARIASRGLSRKFEGLAPFTSCGIAVEASRQWYLRATRWSGFCGGSAPQSLWLSRPSLFHALDRVGFKNVVVGYEDPDHINGPALAFVATK